MEKKIFCFDLDGTICTYKQLEDGSYDYVNVLPIEETRLKIVELFIEGHKIIILTARHMVSCNGDVNLVEQKMRKLTEDWLSKHKIPYHELIFGKPYADFYIDDKAFEFTTETIKNLH